MDPQPPSPSSAARSLRSLRRHDPSRGANSFPSDSDSDGERDGRRHLELRQQRSVPPHLSAPKVSLRRILEQRNLLPVRSASAPIVGPAPSGAVTTGSVDTMSGALDARHPSVRSDHRVSRVHASGLHDFSHLHERHRSTERGGGYEGENYGYGSSSSSSESSFLASQRRRMFHQIPPRTSATASTLATSRSSQSSSRSSTNTAATAGSNHSRRRVMTPEERRRARTCVIDGCNNYIVDNHRCFRHGGGKRCLIDGCNSSAKQLGLCWRHGGSVLCKVEGCTRGVKVKGLCWGHGGGKKKKKKKKKTKKASVAVAQPPESSSPDVSAGPRCIFDDCQQPASLHSFCDEHSQEVARPGYVFEL